MANKKLEDLIAPRVFIHINCLSVFGNLRPFHINLRRKFVNLSFFGKLGDFHFPNNISISFIA